MKSMQGIFLNLVLFGLSPMIFAGEFGGKPSEVSRQERSKIEAREKEIGIEKKKLLDELKQREGKEKTESDIKQEEAKNATLKKLLAEERGVLGELEQFGTSEEKNQINKKRQELAQEEVALEKRVNALNRELGNLGASTSSSKQKDDAVVDEKIKNNLSLSEGFKTRLKVFFNEAKAKIAETIFGNKTMAAKARQNLDVLYEKLNDPVNRETNARAWGKLLPELTERLAFHIKAFERYSQQIDGIAEQIRKQLKDNPAGKDNVKDLELKKSIEERKAIEDILVNLAVDFRMLQQQLEDPTIIIPNQKQFVDDIKAQLAAIRLVNIGTDQPWLGTLSTIERNKIEADQKKFLKSFQADTKFNELMSKSDLNDVDYKNILGKLNQLENLDFSLIDAAKSDDLYYVLGTLYSSFSSIEEALIKKRNSVLEELAKNPNAINKIAELRSIEERLALVQDKIKTWGSAYRAEFERSNVGNKEKSAEIEGDNTNAKTMIAEIDLGKKNVLEIMQLLKDELKKTNLGDLVTLSRKQLELAKQMDAIKALIDKADPSKDAVNFMYAMSDAYADLTELIKSRIEFAKNASVKIPAQREITQIYLDALNRLTELNRQITIYANLLTIANKSQISSVKQVIREKAIKMIDDASLPDALKNYIKTMRDLAKKHKFSSIFSEELPIIGPTKDVYEKVLFGLSPQQLEEQQEDSGDYGY